MNKQPNIIQRRLPVIQFTLLDILKVQFEHVSVRAQCIACITSLVKMFQIAYRRNDQFAFLIEKHVALLAPGGLNFNNTHESPPPLSRDGICSSQDPCCTKSQTSIYAISD